MTSKEKGKRRRFTSEFKREAVRLLDSGPDSAAAAAKKLGIDRELMYKWRKELQDEGAEAFRGNGNRTTDQERIRELEAEVTRLRMERDFLKKTAAYFAKNEK